MSRELKPTLHMRLRRRNEAFTRLQAGVSPSGKSFSLVWNTMAVANYIAKYATKADRPRHSYSGR